MSTNELVAELITAANQNARIKDLKDSDFLFDFLKRPHTSEGQDGFITVVNPSTFPALLLGGGAIGVGMIGPCGLNTPHVHPRASEINLNLGGGDLQAQFIQENNARVVSNIAHPGSAVLFPKGAIHLEQNLGCRPVNFLASFDNVDPGVSQIANNLFQLDKEIVSATFNDIGVEYLDKVVIPPAVALGARSCFDRCGIDRTKFKFNGTFADFFNSIKDAKVPAPTGFDKGMWGLESEPTSSMSFRPSQDVPFSQNPLRSTVMGLTAALVTVILLAVYMGVTSKRRQRKAKNAQMFGATSSDAVIVEYRDVIAPAEKA